MLNVVDGVRQFLGRPRVELLSGILVAFALIPEAIGFSVVAGVPPEVALYSSAIIPCVIAFAGGRPAMISAATASTAVLMGGLVRAHGLPYLLAATMLMGVLQVAAGAMRLARVMRFVSRSVLTGFVNALAILIFAAQLPQLVHVPPATYALIAAGLAMIFLLPRVTRAVPSALIAVVVLTAATWWLHLPVRTVADLGALPTTLPIFALPDVPLTFGTLRIIAPLAVGLAAVGLLETLLTAEIVDDRTDTRSGKHREAMGQGVANFVTACFGGMGGCAMIGQSIINVTAGARSRLSTLCAGLFLLSLLVMFHGLLSHVPVAALTAVMIMVSINTFSWRSIADLRVHPWQSSVVMLATVGVVVATGNLSIGVLVGVILSGVFFAGKVSRLSRITAERSADGTVSTYRVQGQIFFASAGIFADAIDMGALAPRVVIDVADAHFWDISSVHALDRVVLKARTRGSDVSVIGLNAASATIVERFGRHNRSDAVLPAN